MSKAKGQRLKAEIQHESFCRLIEIKLDLTDRARVAAACAARELRNYRQHGDSALMAYLNRRHQAKIYGGLLNTHFPAGKGGRA